MNVDSCLVTNSCLDADVLLGPRDDLTVVYAKQVYIAILGGCEKENDFADSQLSFTTNEHRSVLLGMALKPMPFSMFKLLLSYLETVRVW